MPRHRAVHPEYPYVGKFINTLTLKQVKQLDCGSLPQAGFPGQQPDPGAPAADRAVYAQNRWAAARFGTAAGLIHPEEERLASPGELLAELLERVEPRARRLGSTDLLGRLDGLDQAGAQLEIGRRDGVRSLCETLVALTYDGL